MNELIDLAQWYAFTPNLPMKMSDVKKLANGVLDLSIELPALRQQILKDNEELEKLTIQFTDTDMELARIKERYRWRKQLEEPAPDGTDLEVYIPPCQGDGINGFASTAMLTMFRHGEWKVWPNEYWRPLDLPEEESK